MRLMTVTLKGYRRFEAETRVDVASDVVALVGPNEAGKSSILHAMLDLSTSEPIPDRDQTRDATGPTQVTVGYLDDDDRARLADIPGGAAVQWCTFTKSANGKITRRVLSPFPQRDLKPRHELAWQLLQFKAEGQLGRLIAATPKGTEDLFDLAVETLSSDVDTLDPSAVVALHELGDRHESLEPIAPDEEAEQTETGISIAFRSVLENLAAYDEGPAPAGLVADRLWDLRPKFRLFEDEDRNLRSTYDLTRDAYDPPAALDNLARLANVRLTEQLDAAKIFYTTHSAGCLPRDLGNDIRAVSPIGDTGRSTFRNNIWGGENAGVSPLVFAMGATTFAFLPARHVLMVEARMA